MDKDKNEKNGTNNNQKFGTLGMMFDNYTQVISGKNCKNTEEACREIAKHLCKKNKNN